MDTPDGSTEGAFEGIVIPCSTCLGIGEIALRLETGQLQLWTCPICMGLRRLHIPCRAEEIDGIVRMLPPPRHLAELQDGLTNAGVCGQCYGAGVLASIEFAEDRTPIRYLEAACPACPP